MLGPVPGCTGASAPDRTPPDVTFRTGGISWYRKQSAYDTTVFWQVRRGGFVFGYQGCSHPFGDPRLRLPPASPRLCDGKAMAVAHLHSVTTARSARTTAPDPRDARCQRRQPGAVVLRGAAARRSVSRRAGEDGHHDSMGTRGARRPPRRRDRRPQGEPSKPQPFRRALHGFRPGLCSCGRL
jgi:hypothetical protein